MTPDCSEETVERDATARTVSSAPEAGLGSRRTLVRGAGGLTIAACGLYLPAPTEEAQAKPVDDVQDRADKRRQRRRNRDEQRRQDARDDAPQDRNDHDTNAADPFLGGFDLWLHNYTGDVGLHVECGFDYDGHCKLNAVFNMGTTHAAVERFATDETSVYVWWANRFWIEFRNEWLVPVWIEVADGGSARGTECQPGGHLVLPKYDMAKDQFVSVELSNRYFVDFRRDGDWQGSKRFSVWFHRHPLP